jgi:hypothetical protein
MLAAEEHLAKWIERNGSYSGVIQSRCAAMNIAADASAATQIARWAYGQAFAVGSMTWLRAKELRPLGANWEMILRPGL